MPNTIVVLKNMPNAVSVLNILYLINTVTVIGISFFLMSITVSVREWIRTSWIRLDRTVNLSVMESMEEVSSIAYGISINTHDASIRLSPPHTHTHTHTPLRFAGVP